MLCMEQAVSECVSLRQAFSPDKMTQRMTTLWQTSVVEKRRHGKQHAAPANVPVVRKVATPSLAFRRDDAWIHESAHMLGQQQQLHPRHGPAHITTVGIPAACTKQSCTAKGWAQAVRLHSGARLARILVQLSDLGRQPVKTFRIRQSFCLSALVERAAPKFGMSCKLVWRCAADEIPAHCLRRKVPVLNTQAPTPHPCERPRALTHWGVWNCMHVG